LPSWGDLTITDTVLKCLASDFPFVPEKYSRFVSKTLWPMPTLAIMFPASSIVKQVQNDDENNRFYAQAEVMLAEDLDHAELQLRELDSSVYAAR
jgi:hypothetical protein